MKILMQTMHISKSIGASLQTCALGKKLTALGHEPWLLYYVPAGYCDVLQKQVEFCSVKALASYCINGRYYEQDRRCFAEFRNAQHPGLTEKYTTQEALMQNPPEFDVYLCGSDQIWNPYLTDFDPMYFFPYVKNSGRKVSYAASIGCDVITPEIDAYLREGLSHMDRIGVREDTAVEVVQHYLPGAEITQNIDPTFLLSADQWTQLERRPQGRLPERYCLYYGIGNRTAGHQILRHIKDTYALPCVSFNGSFRKDRDVDVNLHGIGPGEFLYLCRHAEIVITNSFHGFSLPVNLGKRVICFQKPGQNIRMESLSRLLKLQDLIVTDLTQVKERNWEKIWSTCYDGISGRILAEQQRADDYIRKALQR